MPLTDPFPVDQNRIIKALEERIAALESQVRARPGAPVLKASGPFNVPSASSPSAPTAGASIYFSDGFRYIDSAGNDKPIGGLVAATVAPTFPGSFSSPATVSGSVTPANYNALRLDVVNQVFTPLRELITLGHNAGFWPS